MALKSHIDNLSAIFSHGEDFSLMKSKNPEYTVKRDFRLLRAKVLKILEDNFIPNPSAQLPRKPQYRIRKNLKLDKALEVVKTNQEVKKTKDSFKTIKQIEENFLKTREDELAGLTLKSPRIIPKYMDRDFNSTKIKFPKDSLSSRNEYRYEKPLPTIDLLCKYLHPIEIEHVCRDPIYFLGVEAYQRDPNLLNLKGWTQKSNNGTVESESDDEAEDEPYNLKRRSPSSYFKNYAYYDELSKTTLKHIRNKDKETPVIKNQMLLKERVQTVKRKIQDDTKRFEINRAQEVNAEVDKMNIIQHKLTQKFRRAEKLQMKLELSVKERVQSAQQLQDEMHQRLGSTRQKQSEEEKLRQTNYFIKKNLVSKIATEKAEQTKRAKAEKAFMYRTSGTRNFFGGTPSSKD